MHELLDRVKRFLDKLLNILPIIILAVILGIGWYNHKSASFWKASAYQLLTPLIAVCLAFFATQMKSNEREAKRHVEMLLEKIQSIVLEENFYDFSAMSCFSCSDVSQHIQMNNRRLSNCITNLESYSARLHIGKDVDYIRKEFNSYREFIDTYHTNVNTLATLTPTLKKFADNIDSRCDSLIVKLYK